MSDDQKIPEPANRLSVNLAPSVADALRSAMEDRDITATEATRRAIALLKLANDAQKDGQRLMVVTGDGPSATYQEVLLP